MQHCWQHIESGDRRQCGLNRRLKLIRAFAFDTSRWLPDFPVFWTVTPQCAQLARHNCAAGSYGVWSCKAYASEAGKPATAYAPPCQERATCKVSARAVASIAHGFKQLAITVPAQCIIIIKLPNQAIASTPSAPRPTGAEERELPVHGAIMAASTAAYGISSAESASQLAPTHLQQT
jgi:hypothetical protein